MVLNKEIEYFIDLKTEGITIPWAVYSPGMFFSFSRNLSKDSSRTYSPNGVLSVTAGARSIFMLPNIGCTTNHANFQRDFNIRHVAPKSLYDHWHVFKEITDNKILECDWRACLLYFSEKWVTKIHTDEAWLPLKVYFHELAWKYFEYDRSRIYYEIAFCLIQKNRNLKPNPYLTDTARHLFAVAMGDAPGYTPACNENAAPTSLLQKVYVDSYGMKKYLPTIMKPSKFSFENDSLPTYYSLQNPSTFIFSPKSRSASSTQFEMRELQHIMNTFLNELQNNRSICSETVLNEIAKYTEFSYYHNKEDKHNIIQSSAAMFHVDKRFNTKSHYHSSPGAKFAADAPFVRGCISIKSKV